MWQHFFILLVLRMVINTLNPLTGTKLYMHTRARARSHTHTQRDLCIGPYPPVLFILKMVTVVYTATLEQFPHMRQRGRGSQENIYPAHICEQKIVEVTFSCKCH